MRKVSGVRKIEYLTLLEVDEDEEVSKESFLNLT